MRKLKIASALAATTAALALGIAAPASAAPTGAQAVAVLAYPLDDFMGTPTSIISDNAACTTITSKNSARNLHSTGDDTITFYSTSNCVDALTVTLASGEEDNDFGFAALAYTTT
ncbi:hypothetical protein J7E99_34295 [Streptomyces sp. ISL-44]|uniref:hypothetical protein n=1 Tax=Streptomyces sp. ISL-44 TaxID=2819184 RepID=UPI001BE7A2F3|nr:hypothetical protein [Streptomyces sp. ISL-44]MBT2545623.1 hypothetical protein [Streptomyces sp. ISL-44]